MNLFHKLNTRFRHLRNGVQERLFKRPTHVILETTNRCNLNCPYCLVGQQNSLVAKHGTTAHSLMTRPFGFISDETFEAARRNFKDFGIRGIYLHFQGEPLMHKNLATYAKTLKNDGFQVMIFTNGMLFNDNNIEPLIQSGIDLIRFSVDGASEETYQANRVGGKLATVLANMEKVAKAAKGTHTRVEWQFLPMRNNEHEIELAQKLANKMNVHFFWKGYRETNQELAPRNEKFRSQKRPKPCTDIFMQLGVYWNGDVVPCCYDTDGHEIMGNLHKQSLIDIWNGEKYKEFRRRVQNATTDLSSEPKLCRGCLRWGLSPRSKR